ncbi:enoyl-CoA hydratase/isomerase family protein [Roseateles saccharophilus]|uniref:Enoyl-CoA hydratase/carnithine racemase n=1 Tax=Roseateles saccharophilus TaxID=304 RepID=A0A4R3VIJ9_ROSSA|nr:enoyl-CoA hydratase/isomerase family protein [Roseateles saccharophilus]MDG0832492.1 enoyl-CoA hydratase/isomerase family protein [Roseateles saccharophilus]TCV03953.1 enoyl-CoA hydratase/carnithine racemase [Roseateles saccharophilus]
MNDLIPPLLADGQILAEVNGCLGLITLNRPQALNALSLGMIRDITTLLNHWAGRPEIQAVAVLGAGREGKPPAFCAGGDIRFFHQAAHAGDATLEDFFTEEYRLNHLIHNYPKPYVALMDGIVMGGGMGISQGGKLRVLSERSKLAMPETGIGLFPDVGGGWFLAQCPGHVGEWLALTGHAISAGDAIEWGLGDVFVRAEQWAALVEDLRHGEQPSAEHVVATVMERADLAPVSAPKATMDRIDQHFSQPGLAAILASLATADDEWARETHATLLKRSPTMMAVTLELVRRGRRLKLADDLRLERDLVHHAFHLRGAARSETVEGVRALAVDKDHAPRWQPASVAEVDAAEVAAFFVSPWPAAEHPLRDLS